MDLNFLVVGNEFLWENFSSPTRNLAKLSSKNAKGWAFFGVTNWSNPIQLKGALAMIWIWIKNEEFSLGSASFQKCHLGGVHFFHRDQPKCHSTSLRPSCLYFFPSWVVSVSCIHGISRVPAQRHSTPLKNPLFPFLKRGFLGWVQVPRIPYYWLFS